ncbi:MAG TPA: flagellar motor switch protein FliM [Gammaproteobacteria bacterium]|nr:flagellar motor switch protein FliM [Gammaproteobacteria bacterium]
MTDADLLSQEEIDALLSKVDGSDIETGTETAPKGGVTVFDFANQDRIVRGRMPSLEIINERFSREFRISLFNLLRRNAEVSIVGIRVLKFSDYLRNLLLPSSLNMVRVHPLRGTALFVFDPNLVFSVVDFYFGGNGTRYNKVEGRDFSPSEMRVMSLVLEECFRNMKRAWSVILSLDFQYLSSEVNPQFANIVSPSETVVSSVFRIEIDNVGGELLFTMPYSMIEPIRQQLIAGVQSDTKDIDERWIASLRSEILSAEVDLTAVLAEFKGILGDVNDWKKGDIIPISAPEEILLRADYVPVCRGAPGSSDGHYAVQVGSFVRSGIPSENSREILDSLVT